MLQFLFVCLLLFSGACFGMEEERINSGCDYLSPEISKYSAFVFFEEGIRKGLPYQIITVRVRPVDDFQKSALFEGVVEGLRIQGLEVLEQSEKYWVLEGPRDVINRALQESATITSKVSSKPGVFFAAMIERNKKTDFRVPELIPRMEVLSKIFLRIAKSDIGKDDPLKGFEDVYFTGEGRLIALVRELNQKNDLSIALVRLFPQQTFEVFHKSKNPPLKDIRTPSVQELADRFLLDFQHASIYDLNSPYMKEGMSEELYERMRFLKEQGLTKEVRSRVFLFLPTEQFEALREEKGVKILFTDDKNFAEVEGAWGPLMNAIGVATHSGGTAATSEEHLVFKARHKAFEILKQEGEVLDAESQKTVQHISVRIAHSPKLIAEMDKEAEKLEKVDFARPSSSKIQEDLATTRKTKLAIAFYQEVQQSLALMYDDQKLMAGSGGFVTTDTTRLMWVPLRVYGTAPADLLEKIFKFSSLVKAVNLKIKSEVNEKFTSWRFSREQLGY